MMTADNGLDEAGKDAVGFAAIKKDIEDSYKYFEENYKHYKHMMTFIFKSALSDDDRNTLAQLGKPAIEFPILEAYISRIRGEFIKQQPQIDVHAAEGLAIGKVDDEYVQLLKIIQAHLNEIFFAADNDEFSYDIFTDGLAGGFGVAEIAADYVNEKSFHQKITIARVLNPTMCGFDPLATTSHKGDGRYCFKLYPMSQEEFAVEFGEERAKTFNFTRAMGQFNWSFKNNNAKVVLVAEYFVKVQKSVSLVRIAENDLDVPVTMPEKEYNKLVKEWDRIEQVPPILERRKSTTTRIDRYRVCQHEVLDHIQTSYPMLPLVFFDGNSVMVQSTSGGQIHQLTKSYVSNARGVQKLKNYAGQTIGQELEDMPQYKVTIPVEGIPKQYEKYYQNMQVPAALVYNQFHPSQPGVRLDAPQAFPRIPTPPLVSEIFAGSDATTQAILGSYDAILGVNDKQVSGVAIQQGAMQSNAAAIPYLVGYLKGLQRCAEIIIHMLPLYYTTPRTIPVRLPNGKRDYQVINAPYPKVDKQKQMLQKASEMGMGNQMEEEQEEGAESEEMENAIMFNYDPHEINVKIEAGVNAAVQKQVAVEQLTAMMEVSPTFAEFMNRQGLPTLLDNLDIRGIEGLKEMSEQFQAQMESERQQAAGQPTDTDKVVNAEIMKSQLEAQARDQKTQADLVVAIGKLAAMHEELELKKQELKLKAREAHVNLHMAGEERAAKASEKSIEMAIGIMQHQNEMDMQEKQMQQPQQAPA